MRLGRDGLWVSGVIILNSDSRSRRQSARSGSRRSHRPSGQWCGGGRAWVPLASPVSALPTLWFGLDDRPIAQGIANQATTVMIRARAAITMIAHSVTQIANGTRFRCMFGQIKRGEVFCTTQRQRRAHPDRGGRGCRRGTSFARLPSDERRSERRSDARAIASAGSQAGRSGEGRQRQTIENSRHPVMAITAGPPRVS